MIWGCSEKSWMCSWRSCGDYFGVQVGQEAHEKLENAARLVKGQKILSWKGNFSTSQLGQWLQWGPDGRFTGVKVLDLSADGICPRDFGFSCIEAKQYMNPKTTSIERNFPKERLIVEEVMRFPSLSRVIKIFINLAVIKFNIHSDVQFGMTEEERSQNLQSRWELSALDENSLGGGGWSFHLEHIWKC